MVGITTNDGAGEAKLAVKGSRRRLKQKAKAQLKKKEQMQLIKQLYQLNKNEKVPI
jgi:hypothetical protein